MDQFVLSIGPDGAPWSLKFNEVTEVGLGEQGDYSEGKTRALVLLALYTASKRKKGKGNDKLCPSLKMLDIQAAKSLSEAICNDKVYKASAAKTKETGSKFNASYWLVAIFGERPLGKYLTGSRHTGDAAFTENVKIIIQDDRDSEIGDDPEIIASFLSDYLNGVKRSRKTVYLALNLQENGERPATIIDTNSCEGSFRNNAKFWIDIKANFDTHFHVFWISPDDSYILSPSARYQKLCETSESGVIPKNLRFGQYGNMTISPPIGNQICVLLLSDMLMTEKICNNIQTTICECIPESYRRKPLRRPELTKHKIENTQQEKRGLIIPAEAGVERWQDKLAERLGVFGGILYVFSVPHV